MCCVGYGHGEDEESLRGGWHIGMIGRKAHGQMENCTLDAVCQEDFCCCSTLTSPRTTCAISRVQTRDEVDTDSEVTLLPVLFAFVFCCFSLVERVKNLCQDNMPILILAHVFNYLEIIVDALL